MTPRGESVSGDDLVRELVIAVSEDEDVLFTWDTTDDSVRVRHRRGGVVVVDLFRELATLLTVVTTDSATEVIVEYGSTGYAGRARVQVRPQVQIEDSVLQS